MDQLVNFFPLILIVLVFWLLVIRPASKRQRELRELQGSLGSGDRVMLSSGIHGVVRGVDEDSLRVEIADGVVIRVARAAIGSRVDPVVSSPDEHSDEFPDTRGD